MAEVLLDFDTPISDESGTYHPRVVGRLAPDGMWEGWFEFLPANGSKRDVLISAVESRQPQREHLVYWATGLTPVYIEGAFRRARHPITVRTRVVDDPVSDRPAPRVVVRSARDMKPDAVLDPFEIGSRSLDILDQELRALNRPRLLNIIDAFHLNPAGKDLSWMNDAQLVRFIVVATETQLKLRS
jgi:hypothetical protein